MDYLISIGLTDEEIECLLKDNHDISDLSDMAIEEMICILRECNCSNEEIKYIIISIPQYLLLLSDNVRELINLFRKYNFVYISELIVGSPYILNLYSYEVEEYINLRLNNNENLEDIIEDITLNPNVLIEI